MLRLIFPSQLARRITLRLLAVAGRIVVGVCRYLWSAGDYGRNDLTRAAPGQTRWGS